MDSAYIGGGSNSCSVLAMQRLDIEGNLDNAGGLIAAGSLNILSGTVTGGTITYAGGDTGSATVAAGAAIKDAAGAFDTLTNAGTVSFTDLAVEKLVNSSNVTVSGNASFASLENTGTVEVASAYIGSGIPSTVSSSTNSGLIFATGTLDVEGNIDNTGGTVAATTLNLLSGTVTGGTVGSAETTATVSEGAAITDAAGEFRELTNAGSVSFTSLAVTKLTNTASVYADTAYVGGGSNSGVVFATGNLEIAGDIDNTDGMLGAADTLSILSGTVTGGTVGAEACTATVAAGAAITNAAGTFFELTNAGSVSFTDLTAAVLVNSSEVTASGNVAVSDIQNSGTVSVDSAWIAGGTNSGLIFATGTLEIEKNLDNTGGIIAAATLNLLGGTVTGGTVGSAETSATVSEGASITNAAGEFRELTNAGSVSFTSLTVTTLVNSGVVTTSGAGSSIASLAGEAGS
ncbi:beta strand repeat-containing protein, partial [Sutterella sp.]|uniref:beta strand repeat-containing protein n=1 Tax=Sutterella sp. TaxID=1981025 RepID=UPI002701919A|nr:hypothetical protein [Sutterella sp.]